MNDNDHRTMLAIPDQQHQGHHHLSDSSYACISWETRYNNEPILGDTRLAHCTVLSRICHRGFHLSCTFFLFLLFISSFHHQLMLLHLKIPLKKKKQKPKLVRVCDSYSLLQLICFPSVRLSIGPSQEFIAIHLVSYIIY